MAPVICSWDVGMRHLAYCILRKRSTPTTTNYKIYDWNIIDILKDEDKYVRLARNRRSTFNRAILEIIVIRVININKT